MSVSVGRPGATINFSSRGTAITLGLPGTGLSYRHQISGKTPSSNVSERPVVAPPVPSVSDADLPETVLSGEIRSADVASLTSPDLQGLKDMINAAAAQRAALEDDLKVALRDRLKAWRKLQRRQRLPLRLILRRSIPRVRADFDAAEAEAQKVADAIALSRVHVDFGLSAEARECLQALHAAHAVLSRSARCWDVTSERAVDRFKERSAASRSLTRTPIQLLAVTDGVIAGDLVGLRFQNANGGDLDIFPAFMLIREKTSSEFALVDIRDLTISARAQIFIEDEPVPPDSVVVGYSWLRSNRDGSRDRRFAHNRQIPDVRYGQLDFLSGTGVSEAFQFSNCEAALEFGRAFDAFQQAVRVQARAGLSPSVDRDEVITLPDPAPLPTLPTSMGVFELTSLFAIALCGVFAIGTLAALAVHVHETRLQTAMLPTPVELRPRLSRDLKVAGPEPLKVNPIADVQSAATTVAPAVVPAPIPVEVLVTTQNVNLRAAPDRSSAALRVIPVGTTLKVFDRRVPWVQVGDASPWGWVHSSFLKKAP